MVPSACLRSLFVSLSIVTACSGNPTSLGEPDTEGGSTSGAVDTGRDPGATSSTAPTAGGNDGTADSGSNTTSGNPPDPTTGSTDTDDPPATTGDPGDAAILYINFEGATLTPGADDSSLDQASIASAFNGAPLAPYGRGPKRAAVLMAITDLWAPFNVFVTDTRPRSGDYAMVVVTPTNPIGGGSAGISGQDCGDQNPRTVGAAFASVNDTLSVDLTANFISHIAAHGYGMDHVDGPDVMNQTPAENFTFNDQCMPITAPGSCGGHEAFCPPGQQNTFAELADLFPG